MTTVGDIDPSNEEIKCTHFLTFPKTHHNSYIAAGKDLYVSTKYIPEFMRILYDRDLADGMLTHLHHNRVVNETHHINKK